MTIDAIVPHACERKCVVGDVTIHTTQVAVRPDEREPVLLMQLRDIVHQPRAGRMASGTVVTNGHRVNIGMAGDAIRWDRGVEKHGAMTRLAIHLCM